ncbi:MAG: hypothetical protein A2509_03110 [Candidatus Edwardsbacteria bacterium RIFOXYD12_FULL_50_11]|uniref:Protein NO VEIN C-terminal domain-containing protein n=1 Tax=Candidatus Edwardsbacteria bacterium GWF2_54_11 TaxID=1817851 RepID=A0A1F5RHY1_9BACT|nr:MAG: hypothetical protein A2502_06975 [Candidatus Edwardsbacteria bacterium RifOxyC12_full_54_24]OGF06962.1 MAG: hypothetical protein A2273_08455 [Candidatus Edwardsbacteria bacterium RifOxyA12_full_54_48]OGF11072.1 MAG: hypothetical protein A3K15_08055 [Candidatus Edwardsbacteria bacterium GWE2_54_12]OGF14029.1 MAG: hypothetical protein A2024_05710 [Candidatus Edwardsbacteria bacterium GWF2_54_11]OGF16018.1 MAG: hypothetical protein A2509_03110 [Candidatus Edwardsbacteria bacterium RIFOXYD1
MIIIGQAEIRDTAVNVVYKWYRKRGWRVVIQKRKPYDLVANKGNNRRYVEIKGTMNQPNNFRALLSKNEKLFIDKCRANKMHYRLHVVAGIGRYKEIIHKWYSERKLSQPKPAGHYYITVKLKD